MTLQGYQESNNPHPEKQISCSYFKKCSKIHFNVFLIIWFEILTMDGVRVTSAAQSPRNDEPVIGVLTQEIPNFLESKWPGVYGSYIASSYIKFAEGGGARVVPIS